MACDGMSLVTASYLLVPLSRFDDRVWGPDGRGTAQLDGAKQSIQPSATLEQRLQAHTASRRVQTRAIRGGQGLTCQGAPAAARGTRRFRRCHRTARSLRAALRRPSIIITIITPGPSASPPVPSPSPQAAPRYIPLLAPGCAGLCRLLLLCLSPPAPFPPGPPSALASAPVLDLIVPSAARLHPTVVSPNPVLVGDPQISSPARLPCCLLFAGEPRRAPAP